MKEVAQRAGVSRSAVSAALSGKPSTIALSDDTRQRIKQIAGELGYERNILAQSFIKQKSYLVSLLSREEHFVYALETTKGIEEVIENLDYSLLIYYGGTTADDQAKHLQRCLDRKVEGLIVAVAPEKTGGTHAQQIKALYADGLPVVQIYRKLIPELPVVMTSDLKAGELGTRYLIEMGHKRIAHFTHDHYLDPDRTGLNRDALERYQGYEQAMRAAGLEPYAVTYPAATYRGTGYSRGARQYAELISAHPARFTAVTTFSDYTAIGLLKGMQDRGVRVPDDISIIGYDDIEVCAAMEPPLTTMRQPSRKIGSTAVQMVLDMISGRPVTSTVLSPHLVERGSAAPPKQP
ncbi:MAG TPA: LacI family DNA-binding transcriptional regulator [Planctomycetota bacterium]|jgi:DNA-binding LacI/PurR family transcriptional regulator